eukprot:jgi/Psemu1/323967/estExt_fgenesh1_pg.C_1080002
MKFPFRQTRDKTEQVCSDRPKGVRIMKLPFQRKKKKDDEVSEAVQVTKRPPSPTSVRDFALFHPSRVTEEGKEFMEEEKEADYCDQWNSSNWIRFDCSDSFREMFSESSDSVYPNDGAAATTGWNNITKRMYTGIEDFQEKYHANHQAFQRLLHLADLGDFALTAVQKNQDEMDGLLGRIDKDAREIESGMVNPLSWLRNEGEMDVLYDQTVIACSEMNLCATPIEYSGDRDVIIVVQLPSDIAAREEFIEV